MELSICSFLKWYTIPERIVFWLFLLYWSLANSFFVNILLDNVFSAITVLCFLNSNFTFSILAFKISVNECSSIVFIQQATSLSCVFEFALSKISAKYDIIPYRL